MHAGLKWTSKILAHVNEKKEKQSRQLVTNPSEHCVFLISLGFITKIFGLSEFALIGNWTVLALHGHKVTVNDVIL